ncbi:hypothetical protein [Winogradskyella forsetii]|uniref:hypothetical protein n=1 Tax=Winogradskyella forsetii TaxID=2686077 RepID=UPI0015C11109|nr:hypothetical protein [Winogradskyella forsetii]
MEKSDNSNIKSEILKEYWHIASDIYNRTINALSYYDLENPSSYTNSSNSRPFFGNTLWDLDFVTEIFTDSWNYYYKFFVLESMRDDVILFFKKLQTRELEKSVSAPHAINVIDIHYDLLNGFDLDAVQSELVYPWEKFRDFQPNIECKFKEAENRLEILDSIYEEIWKELNLNKYYNFSDSIEYDFKGTINEMTDDESNYLDFIKTCWMHVKANTGSKVLGFMFVHEETRFFTLDDRNFKLKTNWTEENQLAFKKYLSNKGINE